MLSRSLPIGWMVCLPATSAFQDVRVLEIDEVSFAILTYLDSAHTVAELIDECSHRFAGASPAAIAHDLSVLLDGLEAARIIERL